MAMPLVLCRISQCNVDRIVAIAVTLIQCNRGRRGRGGRGNNPRFHPGNNLHNNIDSARFNNIIELGLSAARGNRRGASAPHFNSRAQVRGY